MKADKEPRFAWIDQAYDTELVRIDQDLWLARCVERMLEVDPWIDRETASRMAAALWTSERFRLKGPDVVAEFLMRNGTMRP